ncbi:MAG: sigma-70 family RNA polymerase sigma factor [Planctomycetota bacterium]
MIKDTDELLKLAIGGDETALAELFAQFKDHLRRIVAFRLDSRLKGRVDPSDILQEAFIDLLRRLPEFPEKNMSFFVWLRLVTNERVLAFHREHLNTQKRDPRREQRIQPAYSGASSVLLAAHLMGNFSSVAGKAIQAEQNANLQAVLDSMDPIDREVIALRIFEGLTNSEAAEVLELTKQTTSKRFIRAIRRLREILSTLPGFNE